MTCVTIGAVRVGGGVEEAGERRDGRDVQDAQWAAEWEAWALEGRQARVVVSAGCMGPKEEEEFRLSI